MLSLLSQSQSLAKLVVLKPTPDLSLITTALNEEKNVAHFLIQLRNFLYENKIDHEVIFVDDGSTDHTLNEAKKITDWPNLKIIHLPKNIGTGGAIKEALHQATGNWYAWLPCDLEILPEQLSAPLMNRTEHDIVVTYFGSGLENRAWSRKFMSRVFTYTLNLTFNNRIPYYNGLCLIKRNLINEDSILSNGFFFHAELLIRTLQKTKRIAFTSIHVSPRLAGKSKAVSYKVLKDVVFCFLRTAWIVKFQNERSDHQNRIN